MVSGRPPGFEPDASRSRRRADPFSATFLVRGPHILASTFALGRTAALTALRGGKSVDVVRILLRMEARAIRGSPSARSRDRPRREAEDPLRLDVVDVVVGLERVDRG